MQSNTAIKFAPAVVEDERLDLSIAGDEAVIRLSSWVDGLGWCTQKTIALDETMLDELHRVVTAARLKIKRSRASDEETSEAQKILKFPEFA
jgi:hypothetical protein